MSITQSDCEITAALQRLIDAKPDPVFTAAFETLQKGAPGLSESSCAALARSIAIKVAYGPHGKAHKAMLEALKAIDALAVMEINPSNYDHEIVCELNSNAVQAALIARAAIAQATGEEA